MGKAAYSKRTCRCGKEVSNAGLAQYNHMMGHVRRGEAERMEYSTSLRASTGMTTQFWWKWITDPKPYIEKRRTR